MGEILRQTIVDTCQWEEKGEMVLLKFKFGETGKKVRRLVRKVEALEAKGDGTGDVVSRLGKVEGYRPLSREGMRLLEEASAKTLLHTRIGTADLTPITRGKLWFQAVPKTLDEIDGDQLYRWDPEAAHLRRFSDGGVANQVFLLDATKINQRVFDLTKLRTLLLQHPWIKRAERTDIDHGDFWTALDPTEVGDGKSIQGLMVDVLLPENVFATLQDGGVQTRRSLEERIRVMIAPNRQEMNSPFVKRLKQVPVGSEAWRERKFSVEAPTLF
jgi:hypothetical protein